MKFRINTDASIAYYKTQFEQNPVPFKARVSIRAKATVELVIRATKVAFHKLSMMIDTKLKNREERVFEHSERLDRHLLCLQVAAGLLVTPKYTLEMLPDEIESEELTEEEIPQEKFSLRLHKRESLERYQSLFDHRKVALKHHLSIRLRASVESIIQTTKIVFHLAAGVVTCLKHHDDKQEAHRERYAIHHMALSMIAPLTISPKSKLAAFDEGDLEALENNHI